MSPLISFSTPQIHRAVAARNMWVARAWWQTVVLSTFNSLAACSAAWGLGALIGWLLVCPARPLGPAFGS